MLTTIKNDEQYNNYCEFLMFLVTQANMENPLTGELIELLTVLIEEYDDRDKLGAEYDPVMLMKSIMDEHDLSFQQLAEELEFSNEYHIHRVLQYKERPNEEFIIRFADRFKIDESFLKKKYRLDDEHSLDDMFE